MRGLQWMTPALCRLRAAESLEDCSRFRASMPSGYFHGTKKILTCDWEATALLRSSHSSPHRVRLKRLGFIACESGIRGTLLLDSRVLRDQQLNERRKQRFASLTDVVHELEEPQVDWEFLLGNAPMRTQPTA